MSEFSLNDNPLADAQKELETLRVETCTESHYKEGNGTRRVWVYKRMRELEKNIKNLRGKPFNFDWSECEVFKKDKK